MHEVLHEVLFLHLECNVKNFLNTQVCTFFPLSAVFADNWVGNFIGKCQTSFGCMTEFEKNLIIIQGYSSESGSFGKW